MKSKKTSHTKTIIIWLCLLLIIIAAIVISRVMNSTRTSAPDTPGNTAGNLYNTGLFCENDGIIYFSNPNDDGALYSMSANITDFEKITDDKALYINVDENYIFYSRMNNLKEKPKTSIFSFYLNGLYRINKSGSNLKMLHNDPIGSLLLYDNNLYYQYYKENEPLSIHSMYIDGSDDYALINDDCIAVSARNDRIYYTGVRKNHDINYISTVSASAGIAVEESSYMPIAAPDGIYYISTADGYRIYRVSYDGTEKKLIADCQCSTYNLSPDGRYVYYQRDNSEENGIYAYDTVSGTTSLIYPGDYKWIHTAGNYMFFYGFSDEQVYAYNTDGTLSIFLPPVIDN